MAGVTHIVNLTGPVVGRCVVCFAHIDDMIRSYTLMLTVATKNLSRVAGKSAVKVVNGCGAEPQDRITLIWCKRSLINTNHWTEHVQMCFSGCAVVSFL